MIWQSLPKSRVISLGQEVPALALGAVDIKKCVDGSTCEAVDHLAACGADPAPFAEQRHAAKEVWLQAQAVEAAHVLVGIDQLDAD